MRLPVLIAVLFGLSACSDIDSPESVAEPPRGRDQQVIQRILEGNIQKIVAFADSIESALRPEPLLTSAQIAGLKRYRNAQHLVRARQIGIPQPVRRADVERHLESGRLVRLEDNEYYVLRDMDFASPLAIPDVEAMLKEIGERFQAALAERGLPPLRMEVTSVLRTQEDHARLQRVNPNAARGESTHEFGTTIDMAYSSFAAPLRPVLDLDVEGAPWLEPHLRQMEALAAETGAARMSRELQAILGHVLREMQDEGKVMVTLESRQPVFHLTVARRY